MTFADYMITSRGGNVRDELLLVTLAIVSVI